MRCLKVAVGGTHSTGKTEFISKVADRLRFKGIFCSIVSDLAGRCPLPILRNHTVESTLWIVATGIAEEIAAAHKSQVVLVDRPVVDAWAYLMAVTSREATFGASPGIVTLEAAIRNWVPTYAVIYKTVVDMSVPIEDDQNRDLDSSYRLEIAQQMDLAYKHFETQTRPLTTANASTEIEWVVRHVENNIP